MKLIFNLNTNLYKELIQALEFMALTQRRDIGEISQNL